MDVPRDAISRLLIPDSTIWSFQEYITQEETADNARIQAVNTTENSDEPIKLYTLDDDDVFGTPPKDYAFLPEDDPGMRIHVLEKLSKSLESIAG